MKTSSRFQLEFFRYLENLLPANQKLSIWLSELLQVDSSNAYRRIRGEKVISLDEYCLICQKVPNACNYIFKHQDNSSYLSGRMAHFNNWRSLEKYFQEIIASLEHIASREHTFYYVARDLPFFCFYSDPALIKYKISIWLMSAGLTDSRNVPDHIIELGSAVFEKYQGINSTELWYPFGVCNQLEQLRYWVTMDYISEAEFDEIKNSLINIFLRYEKWLLSGEKPGRGKLHIYGADFCIMNNAALLEAGDFQVLMNGFQGIHFINTGCANAIAIFKDHWASHLENANPLTTKKAIYTFFNEIRKHINSFSPELHKEVIL